MGRPERPDRLPAHYRLSAIGRAPTIRVSRYYDSALDAEFRHAFQVQGGDGDA
jgi:hypothetical protein